MTRREQLQERYEDALFALMMDEVATSEGEKAREENERLKNDPDAEVPEGVTAVCMQTIRRHFAKQKVRTAGQFTAKAFSKVAMAAGVAAILFTGAFATSETIRINTMNLVVEVFGESTDFHFGTGDSASTGTVLKVTAGWLPEGYVLEDQVENETESWYVYQKSENESMKIKYNLGNGAVLAVDSEDAEAESVEINGIQAMLATKGNDLQLVWATADKRAFIQIMSTAATRKELIHVAKELEF